MYIPLLEIKDSYIIKNRLDYNSSSDLEGEQKMMFIDYDFAKKTQLVNAENFNPIIITETLTSSKRLDINYFNETHSIYFDGEIEYEDLFNPTNIINYGYLKYQKFYTSGTTYSLEIDEMVTVEIYQKLTESGTTTWEYQSSYMGETFSLSGLTQSGIQWIVTESTTTNSFETGTTIWSVFSYIPILKYETKVIGQDGDFLIVENKIDRYLFNDYISLYNTDGNIYYKITSNNHCDNEYTGLYSKLKLYKHTKNFDYNVKQNQITLTPILNHEDIYFSYDKIKFEFNSGSEYTFTTDCIYNKYTLIDFLNQFEILYLLSGTTTSVLSYDYIMDYDNVLTINYIDLTFVEDVDLSNYKKYTYINLKTDLNPITGYNAIIKDITNNMLRVISPLNITTSETITTISTIFTAGGVSSVLEKTYENYDQGDYKKIDLLTQRRIYNAYADIISKDEVNAVLRTIISGLIYENENNIMVLKIFNPNNINDVRLTYEPYEIVTIGTDNKTSVPIIIENINKI